MMNEQFNGMTKPGQIPTEAYEFTTPAQMSTSKEEGKRRFSLKLYDGGINRHWYWGNFAFDLSGMKLAKKSIGILFEHDTAKRIGVSDTSSFDGAFTLAGNSLDNPVAKEILDDADAGFPFEASLRFDPNLSKAQFVPEGQTVQVNGKTLKGPGTLFTSSVIMEGSVCVFGALAGCKAEAFHKTNIERNNSMTLDEFKAAHPDLFNQVFELGKTTGATEATAASKKQFLAIVAACGDDSGLAVKCFTEGKTEAEALAARNASLTAEIAAMKASKSGSNAGTETKTAAGSEQTKVVDAAKKEFSDNASDAKNNKPAGKAGVKDLAAMSDEQIKAEFAASDTLKSEFSSAESLIAFVRNVVKGNVRGMTL